jgi:ABC-type lipoprotein release transport system permease subunit
VPDADRVLAAVRATPGVEAAAGRIYGFAHASIVSGPDGEVRAGGGEEVGSPVVTLLGVEPGPERAVTDLARRVVEGRWLEGETDVVLGAGVARRIGARVGDAFLPTAMDTNGAMRGPWAVSDAVPRVVGVVRTGMDEIDGRGVILTRGYLARLTGMEGRVHEIAIRARSAERLDALVGELRGAVAEVRAGPARRAAIASTRPLALSPAGRAGAPALAVRLVGVEAAEGRSGAGRPPRGRFVERTEDIVVTSVVADRLGLTPGDRVSVEVPVDCGDDVPAAECPPSVETLLVAGVVESEPGLLDGRFALVASQLVRGDIAALAPGVVDDLEGEEATAVAALVRQAAGALDAGDEILSWDELAPDIVVMLVVFDAVPVVMVFVIFLAVAIGIVNTLLMSTFERFRELGLMKALGMRPGRVVAMVLAESAAIAALGVAGGLALGLAVVAYWSSVGLDLGVFMGGGGEEGFEIAGIAFDPVVWPRAEASDLAKIVIPVAFLTVLAGLWPALKAARIQVTDALRHV